MRRHARAIFVTLVPPIGLILLTICVVLGVVTLAVGVGLTAGRTLGIRRDGWSESTGYLSVR